MKKTILLITTLGLAFGIANPAIAALSISIYESGPDVVVVASGTINTTDLGSTSPGMTSGGFMNPANGQIGTGSGGNVSLYNGLTSAPLNFGFFNVGWGASSSSGDTLGLFPTAVIVPDGYLSNAPLNATSTYSEKTFAGLGLTPGIYTWNWGSGGNTDSATINIGAVPEPSSAALSGLAGILCVLRRRR